MNLTAALAILGGLLLAGIVGHGAWQARRANGRAPQGAGRDANEGGPNFTEPVFDAPRIEPTLDGAPLPATDAAGADGSAAAGIADLASAGDMGGDAFAMPPRRHIGVAPIDALIDAIVGFAVDSPVAGETALAHMPGSRRAGSKPFLVEGLDTESGAWEPVVSGRQYSEFQAGIQLANRSGAMNEIEYSEFVQKMQVMAEGIGATLDCPDMLDVVARARELDAFATHCDAQLAMRLRTQGSAWSVGFLQQQAMRCGFVAGALPGRMVLPGAEEASPPVLVLQFDAQAALAELPAQSTVRELTLEFDVPQTPREQDPFETWLEAGRALALALGADVTDDQGNPMQVDALKGIENELGALYDRLAEHDLAAGSAAARRLFS